MRVLLALSTTTPLLPRAPHPAGVEDATAGAAAVGVIPAAEASPSPPCPPLPPGSDATMT